MKVIAKVCWLSRSAGLVAASLAFLLIPAAHAQDAGERVVRLSRAEGQVLVLHSGSDTWEQASVNLPLRQGDALAIQDGRAEIEFEDGAMAYLAENSVLQFTELDFTGGARATQLNLTQGAGTFDASTASQELFRVVTLTFDVTVPERAEFRVDSFQDGAAVQVLLGGVSVSTTNGSTNLDQGQSVAVSEADFQGFSIIDTLPAEDAFLQWVTQEGERIRSGNQGTLGYIRSPSYYGLSDLAIYGTWSNVPDYGNVWRPFSLGFSFTPFLNGRWAFDPALGWIWVSSEPWGWMPYHFGSWLLEPTLGWVWVPGGAAGLLHWQPARVNWVQIGNRVGWVPMSPEDRRGEPANLAHVVISRPVRPSGNGSKSNEIVEGKDARGVTPLMQPPPQTTSGLQTPQLGKPPSTIRPAPGTRDAGAGSAGQPAVDNGKPAIANQPGPAGRNARTSNAAGAPTNPPVAPPAKMPAFDAHAGTPRVTSQPAAGTASSPNTGRRPGPRSNAQPLRGPVPNSTTTPTNPRMHPTAPSPASPSTAPRPAPASPAARPTTQTPQGTAPMPRTIPAQPQTGMPSSAQPRPGVASPAAPRPVAPPPTPSASPAAGPAPANPAAHPATPTPQPASPKSADQR